MSGDTRVAGLKDLLQGLRDLPGELGKKAIWSALLGAGREVVNKAVTLAPVLASDHPSVRSGSRKPGTLRRSIKSSRSRINKGQNGLYEVIVRVKPLKAAQKKKFRAQAGAGALNPDDPYYWWWVEFGTSERPASPFMRPAFETTKTAQLERLRVRMKAAIALQAKKIAAEVNRGKT